MYLFGRGDGFARETSVFVFEPIEEKAS